MTSPRALLVYLAMAMLTLCVSAPLHAQLPPSFSVVPADPKNLELLVLQVRTNGSYRNLGVRFENGVIRLDLEPLGGFSAPLPYHVDVPLGQFPAGTYTVAVYFNGFPRVTPSLVYSEQIVVTNRVTQRSILGQPEFNAFPIDVSDLWWSPPEAGWALTIKQNTSDQLFAVWYVYGANGQPVWYTLQPGQWTTTNTNAYTGPIYRSTGPYFGGPFDPNQVDTTQVGTGTIAFSYADYKTGTFSYTVGGVSATKPIARLFAR